MKSVDAAAMREIDTRAQEEFGIPEILLMESAGREAAEVIREKMKEGQKGKVAFFCGKGNNGGDGFVAAKYCFQQGIPLTVFFIGRQDSLKGSTQLNFEILSRLGCPVFEVREVETLRKHFEQSGEWILGVDALLGIGLSGEVKGPYRSAIEEIRRLTCPILAIDIPSGLCATTGKILGCSIKADWTVTFGLPKKGFFLGEGPSVTGKVIVKNIGYPQVLLS